MGIAASRNNSETINWNNIKTENMSSSILPITNELSNEAHELISNLNIPSLSEINTSEYSLNNKFTDHLIFSNNKISNKNIDKYLNSTTSEFDNVFINSDYKNKFQSGGSKKNKKDDNNDDDDKKMKHKKKNDDKKKDDHDIKKDDDDDSDADSDDDEIDDTSSSSITSSSSSSDDKKNDCPCNKKENNNSDKLSYLSSSAHTGGEFSDNSKLSESSKSGSDGSEADSSKSSKKNINNLNSDERSSILNENNHSATTMSVNTSDINLINNY
jgi:hypothetical protein